MIEVSQLSKHFVTGSGAQRRQVTAIDDVSFRAADGRITALLGPNGAGKTTTLRILATLMRPDAGHAYVGGADVRSQPRRVRECLGVLSDARGLYTRLTARENIVYHAQLRRLPPARIAARLPALAALLDMAALLDRRVEGFSTGERMKVALARALIHDPTHLILDEPTNGLDITSTRALRRLLMCLRDEGRCIVFSTHVMQEVELLSDTIVVVAHGRTVADGSAADLCRTTGCASLEDAFVTLAFDTPAARGVIAASTARAA